MNTIKYLFKSLFSNQTVIDGRKKPWYFSISMFIIGLVLMWVPILSKGYTTYYASSIFNQKNSTIQNIDTAFLDTFSQDYFKEIKFTKSKSGAINLTFDGFNKTDDNDESIYYSTEASGVNTQSDIEYKGTNTKALIKGQYQYTDSNGVHGINYYYDVYAVKKDNKWKEPESTDTIKYEQSDRIIPLQLYYLELNDDYSDSDAIVSFIKKQILNVSDDNTVKNNYPHSFAIFSPNRIYINIYSLHSAKTNNPINGYQGYIADAFGDDMVGKTLYEYNLRDTDSITNNVEKNNKIYQNFADMLHTMAFKTNIKQVWFNIAIGSGIYVGTILLMSGIVIFMHKRKLSEYKDTNYWEALKETMTLAFTPSIIGLAVGFYNFVFEITVFIMAVLLRVFFMYNKIAPAKSLQDNKPLYQARQ